MASHGQGRSGRPPSKGPPGADRNSGNKAFPKFPKEVAMRSFIAQKTQERREAEKAEAERYRGHPPPGLKTIEAQLIVPGDGQMPSALERPDVFDEICQTYKVWIVNSMKPNIFVIYSQSISTLQEVVAVVNWAIHDMRLSNEQLATRFEAQEPSLVGDHRSISVLVGHRPHATPKHEPLMLGFNKDHVVTSLWGKLGVDLPAKAESLMGLGKDLQMRVNFGRLNIRQKKKGLGEIFTHEEFEKLIRPYGTRGGAGLGIKMPDTQHVNAVMAFLKDPANGFDCDPNSLQHRCSLTLASEKGDVSAEVPILPHKKPAVSSIRMTGFEDWSRLKWTVCAPDMLFDWNLEVKAFENSETVPPELDNFIRKVHIQCREVDTTGNQLILPQLSKRGQPPIHTQVSETRMKNSIMMTLRDEQYVVEVSVTRTWNKVDFDKSPDATWSIELYGKRWEEALNTVSSEGRRKDWGKDLVEVWPGSNPSLEGRFRDFLRCVLKVQACLDHVDFEVNQP